ncbi:porin [Kiloniella majae]|uniref:porin n=1 Tax=Kiloniella majae TaxID=1938558 RepID=UPI00130294EB|nr:porin [Kiloniella majae]
MKKVLLASSALVAGAAFAAPAMAADGEIVWSAWTQFHVSSTGVDSDSQGDGGDTNKGVDFNTNSEIALDYSATADNGLTYGLHIELEADQNTENNSDENHIFLEGDFGRVELGDQDSAADRLMVSGSSVGFQFGMYGNYTGSVLGNDDYTKSTGARTASDLNDSSDDTKITYFTPTFNGFKAGVSFAPDSDTGNTESGNGTGVDNHFDAGINYSGNFNDFSIDAGLVAATEERSAAGSDDVTYIGVGGGIMVGYAGFSAAVGYIHDDFEDSDEIDTVDVGLAYTTGPWSASIGAAWSERDVDGGSDIEYTAYSAGVGYQIAPGLSTWVAGSVGEYEGAAEDFTNLQAGVAVSF